MFVKRCHSFACLNILTVGNIRPLPEGLFVTQATCVVLRYYMASGLSMPSISSAVISSRMATAAVASRNILRSGSNSVRT